MALTRELYCCQVKYEKVTATTVASAPDDGNLAALTAADESMDTS